MFTDLHSYPAADRSAWTTLRLGAVGSVFKANGGAKEDDADLGVPCIRYGDLYTRYGTAIRRVGRAIRTDVADRYTELQPGDLLFAASGETTEDIGRSAVNLVEGEVRASGDIVICRPGREVNPEFLALAVDTPAARQQKAAGATGTMIVHITSSVVKTLRADLPPLEEQAAIVKYLARAHARIDRAIAAKRKLIALLEEQKQAIINQAVTRGLDPTAPLKESGTPWLGMVPAHWSVKPIGTVSSLVQTGPFGSQLHADEYVRGGVPVINPSHITSSGIHADVDVSVAERTASRLSRHRFEVGDVVIARRGELGRCAVVGAKEAGWLCGTGSLIVRPDREVDARYLQVRVSSAATRAELDARSTGATMPNLNAQMISSLRLPVPPMPEQQRIIEVLKREESAGRESRRVIEAEIVLLREFRTRLTSDVVTGQVDVRHIAAALPELDPREITPDVSGTEDDLVDEAAEFLEDVEA